MKEVEERLIRLAEWYEAGPKFPKEFEEGHQRIAADIRSLLAKLEADKARIETLETGLRQIDIGTDNAAEFFEARLGARKSPTWGAVNVLQDYLAAAQGTARSLLSDQQQGAGVMNRDAYIVAYLREFGEHIDIDIRNGLHVAEASFDQSPDGDPAEDAKSEADEWRRAS